MMRLRTLVKCLNQKVLLRTLSLEKQTISVCTNLLNDQQSIIKCISYLETSKQLKAKDVTKSIYFLKCSEVKITFPFKVAMTNIPAIFDELIGRNNYSEDCLVKIFCDIQNLIVNEESSAAVDALDGCDFFAHYLLNIPPPSAVHSTAVIAECLNIISLLCVESVSYDRDSRGRVCDNSQFNKIDALIPGVMDILLNPVFLQSSAVVIAACRALERLLRCKRDRDIEIFDKEERAFFASLLASNVFITHRCDSAAQLSLFKLLHCFPTYDVKVALDGNFGGILHTQLSNHLDNAEMVQLIMQCAFHYFVNLNHCYTDGLEMDNSQVLRFICDDLFNKYSSNVDIMLLFCKIVEHSCCRHSESNKAILTEMGFCERLVEIRNIHKNLRDNKSLMLICFDAICLLFENNHHPSAQKW